MIFLTLFAELVKSPDFIHTYRVTPLSLWNAAALDLTLEEISEGLQKFAKYSIPSNVLVSLREWHEAYGKLILEKANQGRLLLKVTESYILERIWHRLELIPLQISHLNTHFEPVPEEAKTVFITKAELAEEAEPEHVILKLERLIRLHFPTIELFERFCKELIHVHFPAKLDRTLRTITYSMAHATLVSPILKRLGEEYKIEVEET